MAALNPLVGKARRSVQLVGTEDAQINIWEGSVRSGKTVSSFGPWLHHVVAGPAGDLVMIGKTERTLVRNIINPLIEMLGSKRVRLVTGSGEVWIFGRRIYLAGANDERAQEKIRGGTFAGAYVDEVSLVPESFFAMLLSRLSVEGAKLFGSTNPDNPNHWLMRDYLKRARAWLTHDGQVIRLPFDDELVDTNPAAPIDLLRMSFRLADNPSLPPGFVRNLMRQFTGLWRRRFIDGEWCLAEGAIYDMFDPNPEAGYVVTDLPRYGDGKLDIDRWIVAVDYGTTNPFVALLIGVCMEHELLVVAREWRWDSRAKGRQMTDAEYSVEMRRWLDAMEADPQIGRIPYIDRVYVDPSAASYKAQLFKDGWPVHSADNEVLDGIRSVASLRAGKHLVVHDSCTGGIAELTSYVWDPDAAKRGKEQPLKVDDHYPDAERYGIRALRQTWRHWVGDDGLDEAA